jgi:hypothetical protein
LLRWCYAGFSASTHKVLPEQLIDHGFIAQANLRKQIADS